MTDTIRITVSRDVHLEHNEDGSCRPVWGGERTVTIVGPPTLTARELVAKAAFYLAEHEEEH